MAVVTYEIDFAAQIARLVQGTERGAASVKEMADKIESASTFARHALEALGVTLSVDYFKDLIARSIETTARMGELAIVAGTTGAAFSAFEEPARTSGTSLETVATAVARLSRSIAEAQSTNPEKKSLFLALGIDPNDGRDAASVMQDVARVLSEMPDKNIAALLSNELLGKSYAELRPFMAAIAEQGALNSTMTDAQIAQAKELRDEYQRMRLQTDLNVRQISEGLVPALKDLVGTFSSAGDGAIDFIHVGEDIGTTLKFVVASVMGAVESVNLLGKSLAIAALAFTALADPENFTEYAKAISEGFDDLDESAQKTGEQIKNMWSGSAAAAQEMERELDRLLPLIDQVGAGGKDPNAAQAAAKLVLDEKRHYEERLAALKGFSEQFAAQVRLANELANAAYRDGAVGQASLIETQRQLEDARLQVQIYALTEQMALAVRRGDLAKEQELKNGVAQAEAARQANAAISAARSASLDLDMKREATQRFAEIQRENLTERERLQDAYLQKKAIIDKAEQSGLYDAATIAQQRELLELAHQAKLGDIVAQGLLARRNFEQLTMQQQVADVFQNLAAITSGAAQHNRTMFEINKVAGIANAIIHTAQGATLALATYPPPISFAMAAAQIAAGLVQVATIKSQSFDSGGGTVSAAAPVFSANPNTGFPTSAASAPVPVSPSPQAVSRQNVNITLVSDSGMLSQDFIRSQFIPALNDALGDGVQLNVTVAATR